MAIPQQLALQLSVHAAAVQDFCNMAPGIPWTNQMLDDMLETLEQTNLSSNIELTPPVHGLTKIGAYIFRDQRKVKKEMKSEIRATVHYYCGHDGPNGFEIPNTFEKMFDCDRAGLKDAICYLQRHVQNVKRRGLCKTCLTAERPTKRLRVSDTNLCGSCLLQKAMF